ncbi:MAG: 23S rRNA (guanosine(2251)-2'-O)-methyltransferase RlmB [Bacteroidales bacterium]|nr:23S rRNA (guanosine(2251)-2'-O)-methyltransferase RlmB [Bacteroidales bacterium]MBN2758065.1 23S rRNA (guanosine(2251)-2'-O)-methyltransferase RlmB [Bacteroidales bacterium]
MSAKKNMIFGIRTTIEAIKAGKDIEKIFIQKGNNSSLIKELMILANNEGVPFQYIPIEKFKGFTGKNHQGVMALLSEITYEKIENILPLIYEKGEDPFILILDQISDVRNFGAITRTAECAGVHAIIIPEKGSASINSDAIKTSAGALMKIPVCRAKNLNSTIDFLKESGLQIIAASEKSDFFYTDINYSTPIAIIMGSEDTGVSKSFLNIADKIIKIPIKGTIESLNVSVATGIILYEALRQKSI